MFTIYMMCAWCNNYLQHAREKHYNDSLENTRHKSLYCQRGICDHMYTLPFELENVERESASRHAVITQQDDVDCGSSPGL